MSKWIINKWYQKTVYVIGWAWVVLFLLGFFIGLVAGMTQDYYGDS